MRAVAMQRVAWTMGLVAGALACGPIVPLAEAGDPDPCQPSWVQGVGVPGMSNLVAALTVFDDGLGGGPAVYAAGLFANAGGAGVGFVARWDGSAWSSLAGPGGVGVDNQADSLRVFDDGTGPALYVGGTFLNAGGVPVNHIARWDGQAWSALAGPGGTGTSNRVFAMEVFDDGTGPALYAGGFFATAGGVTVNGIAKWDGVNWSPVPNPSGVGVAGVVRAMKVFDDGTGPALYVAGNFDLNAGGPIRNIARWDGRFWTPLSLPGLFFEDSDINALEVFDDGTGPALYAGGLFLTAPGAGVVNRIAKWNGTAWSGLSGPSGTGITGGSVVALTVFDDGTGGGPALVAGGFFSTAGGLSVSRIAKWDGTAWSPLLGPAGNGADGGILALTTLQEPTGPALYVGGSFGSAGGLPASRIAKWQGCRFPIVLIEQPQFVLLPAAGGQATLSVLAEGLDLRYQWFRDGVPLEDSPAVAGATAPVLSVLSEGPSMTGVYRCLVSDFYGITRSSADGVIATRPPCFGDLNTDGLVDSDDLKLLLGVFNAACP